jgi:hypothetical protein
VLIISLTLETNAKLFLINQKLDFISSQYIVFSALPLVLGILINLSVTAKKQKSLKN